MELSRDGVMPAASGSASCSYALRAGERNILDGLPVPTDRECPAGIVTCHIDRDEMSNPGGEVTVPFTKCRGKHNTSKKATDRDGVLRLLALS
jgi:hypothetical protein